ncbi:GNAT family N-acetyltransferase [Brevibacterium sp. JNUCC-42]|nr:GNAT family N-acetyltransferase [Brevibacterium sp. JNUCC-42]
MLVINPVQFEGSLVLIEPLQPEHEAELQQVGSYPEIWTFLPRANVTNEDWQAYFKKAYDAKEAGLEFPFIIRERSSREIIGSTRFINISSKDDHLELGSTWLTPRVWKTGVNTECKFLLLSYCFEQLGCVRVQIKTDSRNENSQRAIRRIGATYEGTLRKNMRLANGFVRDTVMFSIIDSEWDQVKEKLALML